MHILSYKFSDYPTTNKMSCKDRIRNDRHMPKKLLPTSPAIFYSKITHVLKLFNPSSTGDEKNYQQMKKQMKSEENKS